MLSKIFLKGLKAILPITLTLGLVVWLLDAIETIFRSLIIAVVGPSHYFTGLGLLVGLVLVFFIGILMNAWIVQKFYDLSDRLLKQIPLVKVIYTSICDVFNFLKSKKENGSQQAVMVEIAGVRILGLVTRETFDDLPSGIGTSSDVAVYLPMSYQIGGHTVIVPKSAVTPVAMGFEQTMRFAVTAGMQMSTPKPPLKETFHETP